MTDKRIVVPRRWVEARHIYLSPHLDDAVLSCGGMIAGLARDGERVAIVTVCAGSPIEPLVNTPIVRELHARWESMGIDAVEMRREEDRRAVGILGEGIEVAHWGFLDCIYRRGIVHGEPLYPDGASLFGEISAEDPLMRALEKIGGPPEGSILYVPLGIGGHVDHRVVRAAAEGWKIGGMVTYEDYPYAAKPGAIEAAVGEDRGWKARVVEIDEGMMARKIDGIGAYESQISSFWTSRAAMEKAVREFVSMRGGERLWLRA